MTLYAVLGIAAGMVGLAANPVYVADIVHGATRPSRLTWWILAVLHILLAASYYASGARETVWLPAAYAISFFIVALLSIKYGEAGWRGTDTACLIGACGCAVFWWVSGSAQLALFLTICVDFFGILPTVEKAYRRPETENRTAWLMATLAALLNVSAVRSWTLAIAAYPLYVLAVNALITLFIMRPRRLSQ